MMSQTAGSKRFEKLRERDINKEAKRQGLAERYKSPFLPIIEDHRVLLRKIDCKPPAEPQKWVETR